MTRVDLTRLRQAVYRLAGAGFLAPSPQTTLGTAGSIPILSDLGLFDFPYSLALVDYIHRLADSDFDELTAAYMALFEVGVGGAACPPTESAWRSDARTGGVATLQSELRRTLLGYGLRPTSRAGHGVDHVSVELDVMSSLCAEEGNRLVEHRPTDRIRAAQRDFLSRHLGPWIPAFTAAVCATDRHPVYTALASATHALVVHDTELVSELDDSMETVR